HRDYSVSESVKLAIVGRSSLFRLSGPASMRDVSQKREDARQPPCDADKPPRQNPARMLDLSFVVTSSLCQKYCGSVLEWPEGCGKEGNDYA
ncbi:hypothetical protein, partial [Salmonella bongori]|uniref:hypothetical protein n=1 Tax=Salmonella bongori TaxID=54736 RepID=UPI00241D82C2